jgi:hypothetical protein
MTGNRRILARLLLAMGAIPELILRTSVASSVELVVRFLPEVDHQELL